MELIYGIDSQKKFRKTYVFPAEATAIVRKNRFGLVTISEKIGGMNGTYKVAYVYPADDGLATIGSAEASMDNGNYVEIGRIDSDRLRQINENEKFHLIKSISAEPVDLIDSASSESVDDAMLFLLIPDLMKEIENRDSRFPAVYTKYLNDKVDSSMANLLRRKFLGNEVGLCDMNQFDVFVCSLDKKIVSICVGDKDGSQILQYRAGVGRKVEISLEKSFSSVGSKETPFGSFGNGDYQYTVNFGGVEDSGWAGVVVEKNGAVFSRQQCRAGAIEPYLLPRK